MWGIYVPQIQDGTILVSKAGNTESYRKTILVELFDAQVTLFTAYARFRLLLTCYCAYYDQDTYHGV